jgi:CBS domain containing-hemolysin-like protein
LWNAIRRFFEEDGETSLRAQLEEAIDEHVDEQAAGDEPAAKGRPLAARADHAAQPAALQRARRRRRRHPAQRDRGDFRQRAWDELINLFAEHGHSRLPVYRDTLDDVIGMIHIKDVFPFLAHRKPPPADWTELMREPLYVPQARGALDVLADMRAKRMHLAIVVDEFSGTDGIVTIEDLVEEIVGDIEDEHDEAPVELVVPLGEGMWDADARAELDDVAETVDDPRIAEVEEAVDTLGGLAFVLAGQVPTVGAVLHHPSGWCIEVTEGDETHVKRLRLHRPDVAEEVEAEG